MVQDVIHLEVKQGTTLRRLSMSTGSSLQGIGILNSLVELLRDPLLRLQSALVLERSQYQDFSEPACRGTHPSCRDAADYEVLAAHEDVLCDIAVMWRVL